MSTFLPVRVLALACAVAAAAASCSSKPMQAKPDAGPDAIPDAAIDLRRDGVVADVAVDSADVVIAIADGAADSARDTSRLADMADAFVSPDLAPPKDVPVADSLGDASPDVLDGRRDVRPDAARGPIDAVDAFDARTDTAAACTPGMNQTCNDSDLVSAVWGRCNPDGTCTCDAGYTINPATGRCMRGARDAATVGDGPAPGCTDDYLACGCGCCGGTTPTNVCYYPELGETTAIFAAQDAQVRQSTNCATVGCALGRRYLCCVAGTPEPAGSASYTADGYMGDANHLTIHKSGADCAELALAGPTTGGDDRLPLQTNGSWKLAFARLGACVDGGPTESARGILGTIVTRKAGGGCVVDVHVSLFTFTTTGEVETGRLDADGVPIDGIGAEICLW